MPVDVAGSVAEMRHTMKIDHANPKNNSIMKTQQYQHDAKLIKSIKRLSLCSFAVPLSILLAMVGSGLQGYANGTIDAFLVALLLLVAGIFTVGLLFSGKVPEMQAFLLTFSFCVFVGGLAQCYSLATYGNPQSTTDAVSFFEAIFEKPSDYYTWYELKHLWLTEKGNVSRGAPLAVGIWQVIYHLRLLLGMDYGQYVGVMFNAFVMGLTGSITVRTARALFGNDVWRLRRVAVLFAICGLFLLFGSILIRDCFTIFFNSLVLLGIIRWLCRPTSRSLLFAGMLTAISVIAMAYLRSRSVVLFGLFVLLASMCWFLAKRLNIARIIAISMVLIALLFASNYLMNYFKVSRGLQSKNIDKYEAIMEAGHKKDSLGMRLIVQQPLPIRLVLGTGSLMVHPIPLWANFTGKNDRAVHHRGEYHIIKGYHGIYQILVLPLVFTGFILIIKGFLKDRKQVIPLVFLAAYLLITTLAVVATSMEQRHLAQFMPALIIIAAIPDTRSKHTRKTLKAISILWFTVVVLVHLAWFTAAMGR